MRRVEIGAQFRHSAHSFAGACSLRAQLFGELVGVHGVLVRLFAEFVSGSMISLAMSRGGRGVAWAARLWSSAARSCVLCGMVFLRPFLMLLLDKSGLPDL